MCSHCKLSGPGMLILHKGSWKEGRKKGRDRKREGKEEKKEGGWGENKSGRRTGARKKHGCASSLRMLNLQGTQPLRTGSSREFSRPVWLGTRPLTERLAVLQCIHSRGDQRSSGGSPLQGSGKSLLVAVPPYPAGG